jgi:hypothetical protein
MKLRTGLDYLSGLTSEEEEEDPCTAQPFVKRFGTVEKI